MDSLVELFCDVDDFCKEFMPVWEQQMLANRSSHFPADDLRMYLLEQPHGAAALEIEPSSPSNCHPIRVDTRVDLYRVAQWCDLLIQWPRSHHRTAADLHRVDR